MATYRKRVYVETSILSFLCAEPSLVLATVARQQATHEWWNHHRRNYEAYTSDEVILEAARGGTRYAEHRLEKAAELLLIEAIAEDRMLADEIIAEKLIPAKALVDATHLAIAVRTKMDFLLTWNLVHLANPVVLPLVYDYFRRTGRHVPAITTPADILGSLGQRGG